MSSLEGAPVAQAVVEISRKKKRKPKGSRKGLSNRAKKSKKDTTRIRLDCRPAAAAPAAVAAAVAAPPAAAPAEEGSGEEEEEAEEAEEGSDEEEVEEEHAADSPSQNTRSQRRESIEDDEEDSDVDEEMSLNRLEQHHQGKQNPMGQPHRKQDSRGRAMFTKDEHRQRRMAIHHFFTTTCGGPPEDSGLWGGRHGVAVRIRKSLMLKKTQSSTNNIMKTMRSISACNAMKKPCHGERDQHKPHEQCHMKTADFEAQLTADLIEAGMGFAETTDKANEWRRANGRKLPSGQTDVGRSCACPTSKRLAPKVTVIKKRPQGSLNKESIFLDLCVVTRFDCSSSADPITWD